MNLFSYDFTNIETKMCYGMQTRPLGKCDSFALVSTSAINTFSKAQLNNLFRNTHTG